MSLRLQLFLRSLFHSVGDLPEIQPALSQLQRQIDKGRRTVLADLASRHIDPTSTPGQEALTNYDRQAREQVEKNWRAAQREVAPSKKVAFLMGGPKDDLLALNPSDQVLRTTAQLRRGFDLPRLTGRIKQGRVAPPYAAMLFLYYKALAEARAARQKSPSSEATKTVAHTYGYTVDAAAKHIQEARSLYPSVVKAAGRKGIVYVESD